MSSHNNLRPVRIENVAIYDGKLGWFHCFGTRTFLSKKNGSLTQEVVGVIELENGRVIQLSTNRFVFLDPESVPVSEWAPAPADVPFGEPEFDVELAKRIMNPPREENVKELDITQINNAKMKGELE